MAGYLNENKACNTQCKIDSELYNEYDVRYTQVQEWRASAM